MKQAVTLLTSMILLIAVTAKGEGKALSMYDSVIYSATDYDAGIKECERIASELTEQGLSAEGIDSRLKEGQEERIRSATGTVKWNHGVKFIVSRGFREMDAQNWRKAMSLLGQYLVLTASGPSTFVTRDAETKTASWNIYGPLSEYAFAARKSGQIEQAKALLASLREIYAAKAKWMKESGNEQQASELESQVMRDISEAEGFVNGSNGMVFPSNLQKMLDEEAAKTPAPPSENKQGCGSSCGSAIQEATKEKSSAGCACGSKVTSATASLEASDGKPAADSCCGTGVKSATAAQALESNSNEIVLSATDSERVDSLFKKLGETLYHLPETITPDERIAKMTELQKPYVDSAAGTPEWCAYLMALGYTGTKLARTGETEKGMVTLEKFLRILSEAPAVYGYPVGRENPLFWNSQGVDSYVETAHKAGKENHARQFLLSVKEIFANKVKRAESAEERQKIERAKSFADKEIDNNLAVLAATPTPVKPKKKGISRASASTESGCCGAKVANATGSKTASEPQSGADSCCGSAVKSATASQ